MEWNGVTRAGILQPFVDDQRHQIADAAKAYDWPKLLALLSARPAHVNATRPDGKAWYTPLHQVAHGGAPVAVAEQLVAWGAFRTLREAQGLTPLQLAHARGHVHLAQVLTPVYRHVVPLAQLLALQAHFHELIRNRALQQVNEHQLRLPELEPLLELPDAQMSFSIPGMYGGFSYRLQVTAAGPELLTESWSRVVGGSGQRHRITTAGIELLEQGFV